VPSRLTATCSGSTTRTDAAGGSVKENVLALLQEDVHMARLRHALPRLRARRKGITLEQGDALAVTRQRRGGDQSRQASAHDHRMRQFMQMRTGRPSALHRRMGRVRRELHSTRGSANSEGHDGGR
jgi:hypothetical protein